MRHDLAIRRGFFTILSRSSILSRTHIFFLTHSKGAKHYGTGTVFSSDVLTDVCVCVWLRVCVCVSRTFLSRFIPNVHFLPLSFKNQRRLQEISFCSSAFFVGEFFQLRDFMRSHFLFVLLEEVFLSSGGKKQEGKNAAKIMWSGLTQGWFDFSIHKTGLA